jgi:hypothetical protein
MSNIVDFVSVQGIRYTVPTIRFTHCSARRLLHLWPADSSKSQTRAVTNGVTKALVYKRFMEEIL